jgi:hypothetical protein
MSGKGGLAVNRARQQQPRRTQTSTLQTRYFFTRVYQHQRTRRYGELCGLILQMRKILCLEIYVLIFHD